MYVCALGCSAIAFEVARPARCKPSSSCCSLTELSGHAPLIVVRIQVVTSQSHPHPKGEHRASRQGGRKVHTRLRGRESQNGPEARRCKAAKTQEFPSQNLSGWIATKPRACDLATDQYGMNLARPMRRKLSFFPGDKFPVRWLLVKGIRKKNWETVVTTTRSFLFKKYAYLGVSRYLAGCWGDWFGVWGEA